MNASVLDSEKIELIRLILDINDAATIHKVKNILNDVLGKKASRTSTIDSFFGGWKQDERTPEEIMSQIHNSRTKNNFHTV